MKNTLLILSLLFVSLCVKAQTERSGFSSTSTSAIKTSASKSSATEGAVQEVSLNNFTAQLYPNPAKDKINVIITSTGQAHYTVQLHSILGQMINVPVERYTNGLPVTISFDLRTLPSAVYFMVIRDNDGAIIHTFKFVKTN